MLERSFARSDRRQLALVESMQRPVKVTRSYLFRITKFLLFIEGTSAWTETSSTKNKAT